MKYFYALQYLLNTLVFGNWLNKFVFFLSIYVIYSTSLQMLRLISTVPEFIKIFIPIILSIISVLLVVRFGFSFNRLLRRLCDELYRIPYRVLFFTGLLIRILWIYTFNAEAGSDGVAYLDLSDKIVNGYDYEMAGTKAYWPVGYPLYLSAWVYIIQDVKLAYISANIFTYFLSFFAMLKILEYLIGYGAKLGVLLFVLWPNLVFNSATPEKEMLVAGVLMWSVYFLIRIITNEKLSYFILLGFVIGCAILIQPSLQLLPIFALIVFFLIRNNIKNLVLCSLVFITGVLLVVAPWSIRNYTVFDKFVLVSTNGGDNLYRANNSLATGGYTARGEVNLDAYGELEKDIIAKKLAKEWILKNPIKFTMLVMEKQVRFLGDDAVGVYNTLKVGKGSDSTLLYLILKLIANTWWMAAWLISGFLAYEAISAKRNMNIAFSICLWLWLYLFVIHSVFESAGKYHVPVIWVICVLIAIYADHSTKAINESTLQSVFPECRKSFLQFINFALIGGAATVLQYTILLILVQIYSVNVIMASSIGFVFSAIFNYYLNYRITFSSDTPHIIAFPKFSLAATSGLIINSCSMWVFISLVSLHYLVSQVIATGVVLFWNFLVNKIWVFNKSIPIRE